MSYRLKIKEPLPEGIKRVAFEQIEIADGELRGNADAAVGVHNARRALKRLRALLRLVRPGLEAEMYRRESQRFAEIGRLLAGTRDRHVIRQTLAKLATSTSLPASLAPALEPLLAQKPSDTTADPRDRAAARLAAARKALAGDMLTGLAHDHLIEGVERVYRKARRLHRQCATADAGDETFHDLRKGVQQHWRHMQLLSRAWPEALSARADEAKALSQVLGEDHDLAVLRTFAQTHAEALPADGVAALRRATEDAQARLRIQARLHGDRLFAEGTRHLTARLRTYWAAAEALAALHAPTEAAPDAPGPKAQDLKPQNLKPQGLKLRDIKPQALKPRVHRAPAAKRARSATPRTPPPRRNT